MTRSTSGAPDVDAVPIGSVVFALIDPTPGHEIAFNRWYERDHYYTAGTAAPGVFSAGRYVAPGWCKAMRDPAHRGVADPGRGSHLALYFVLEGHDADRAAWATDQVERAAAADRLFDEREHLHTWSYTAGWSWVGAVDGVPPALVLDRRFDGLTVAFVDRADGVASDALEQGARACWAGVDDPVADVVALVPGYEVMASTWIGPFDPDRRRVLLFFHDGDVGDGWAASRRRATRLTEAGLASVAWASPFVPARFGTDLHADEL